MNPKSEEAIAAMLNCFPQTNQDYRLLLATLGKLCAGLTDQAIIEAAGRFASGDVQDQSPKFAPSAPEFVAEARRRQEFIDIRSKPRLPAPPVEYRSGPIPPFMVKRQRALTENSDRSIILEDASFEDFKRMSKAGELPAGASWVASVATIYGPRPAQRRAAA